MKYPEGFSQHATSKQRSYIQTEHAQSVFTMCARDIQWQGQNMHFALVFGQIDRIIVL